jgi:hypothetical protein
MKKFLASVASVAMIGSATAQGIPGPEQGREMVGICQTTDYVLSVTRWIRPWSLFRNSMASR